MIETNKIQLGHVLDVLKNIDNETIDCIITSPPYYRLRAYGTNPQIWGGKEDCNHEWDIKEYSKVTNYNEGFNQRWENSPNKIQKQSEMGKIKEIKEGFCIHCNAWKGELGLEPTFELFLIHLWQIFDEIKRVLKKTGTCFINLGDSYGGSGGSTGHTSETKNLGRKTFDYGAYPSSANTSKYQAKSLLQIPSRFAVGMTDRGWILRNEIIWYKRNCMPSSAKDRFTVDFEKIFFFTKSQKYYFEQQFELVQEISIIRREYSHTSHPDSPYKSQSDGSNMHRFVNPELGRNKRCVWDITPTPFSDAHFAVFPQELVEPMIKAGCPEEICNKCGKPKEKIYEPQKPPEELYSNIKKTDDSLVHIGQRRDGIFRGSGAKVDEWAKENPAKIRYSECNCKAGFHPGIVLDPFIGSGTTGIVARKLNRNYIGIELKEEYKIMAEKRFEKELGLFNI